MSNWFYFNPVASIVLVLAVILYVRAARILDRRGRPVPLMQRACFFTGLVLIATALLTRIDPIGEHSLLSAHMLQHLLLADISGPLLLLGVRAPMLYFFWPKFILVPVAKNRPLRRFWHWFIRPVPALTFWLVTLFAWHIPYFYEAALSNTYIHMAEHATFAFGGMLAWWPLLDPTHHRTEAKLWKAAYVCIARFLGGILGIILTSVTTPIYSEFYGSRSLAYGIQPLTDQRIAGSMMMFVDTIILLVGFIWFVLGTAPDQAEDYT